MPAKVIPIRPGITATQSPVTGPHWPTARWSEMEGDDIYAKPALYRGHTGCVCGWEILLRNMLPRPLHRALAKEARAHRVSAIGEAEVALEEAIERGEVDPVTLEPYTA